LVLMGLAASGTPAPAVNTVNPLVLGHFATIEACDTAARAARLTAAGKIGPGEPTGVVFLCVQDK
jgi:hypothetical protein